MARNNLIKFIKLDEVSKSEGLDLNLDTNMTVNDISEYLDNEYNQVIDGIRGELLNSMVGLTVNAGSEKKKYFDVKNKIVVVANGLALNSTISGLKSLYNKDIIYSDATEKDTFNYLTRLRNVTAHRFGIDKSDANIFKEVKAVDDVKSGENPDSGYYYLDVNYHYYLEDIKSINGTDNVKAIENAIRSANAKASGINEILVNDFKNSVSSSPTDVTLSSMVNTLNAMCKRLTTPTTKRFNLLSIDMKKEEAIVLNNTISDTVKSNLTLKSVIRHIEPISKNNNLLQWAFKLYDDNISLYNNLVNNNLLSLTYKYDDKLNADLTNANQWGTARAGINSEIKKYTDDVKILTGKEPAWLVDYNLSTEKVAHYIITNRSKTITNNIDDVNNVNNLKSKKSLKEIDDVMVILINEAKKIVSTPNGPTS
ncbi:MAG: hypothetical protein RR645_01495, partial [Clostridium sp.]